MEGWLHKKGSERTNWNRRYFSQHTSTSDIMTYYVEEKKKTAKGTLNLGRVKGVRRVPDYPGGPAQFRAYAFHVDISDAEGDRTLYYMAESIGELERWYRFFEDVLAGTVLGTGSAGSSGSTGGSLAYADSYGGFLGSSMAAFGGFGPWSTQDAATSTAAVVASAPVITGLPSTLKLSQYFQSSNPPFLSPWQTS
eukprot:ANDGO_00481.mRNA.1 hypothetical protein